MFVFKIKPQDHESNLKKRVTSNTHDIRIS